MATSKIALVDNSATAFNSLEPPTSFDFSKFNTSYFTIGGSWNAGTITWLTDQASAMLEPASMALFGLSLAAIGLSRRRRAS